MKKGLALVMAALVVLVAVPAFAEDGQVPQATLSALGLGGMQVASDTEGMQVRGMASEAYASGMSVIDGMVFSPLTGNHYFFSDAQMADAMDVNFGPWDSSSAEVMTGVSVSLQLTEIINAQMFSVSLTAEVGGIAISNTAF